MYELIVESEFAAAHRLREYDGACERLHGHNWRVELVVGAEGLNGLGMAIDFRRVKSILKEALERFDHAYLNELTDFQKQNPTTENIARVLFVECSKKLPEGLFARTVAVWESPRCGARYTPEPRGSRSSPSRAAPKG